MGPRHFDPRLVEIFMDTNRAFEKIYDQYKDAPASTM
jgi:response regulator RpfG family c-di-GMP phosphodiesterase